jgi:hypothetical protein
MLIFDAVTVRAQSDAAKAAALPTSSSVARGRASCWRRCRPRSSPGGPGGRSTRRCRFVWSVTARIPCGGELDGEGTAQSLDGLEGHLEAAEVRPRIAVAAEGEDHAGALRIMCRAAAREVTKNDRVVTSTGRMRSSVAISTSGVPCTSAGDDAQDDVDAAVVRGDAVGVRVDRPLVERVHDRGLRAAARRTNRIGDRIELRLRSAGEVDRRAFACEGARPPRRRSIRRPRR